MHIYFSGIGGTGIGPLALIAKQAGYDVSGSDLTDSSYISYLQGQGINSIHIGQTKQQIADVHAGKPIDWFVYSSAQPLQSPDNPEPIFCDEHGIRKTKRDELLNKIIEDKKLELIAVAGTHGKTTTTAMVIWLLEQLKIPASYSVGAKTSFSDMGHYAEGSKYFVYECDEFDRNFLAFHPSISLITGVTWDHHEIFPSQQDYFDAFKQFISQSSQVVLWKSDAERMGLPQSGSISIFEESDPGIGSVRLDGKYNRQDGWLAAQVAARLSGRPLQELMQILNAFPGVSRRFEKIIDNLYTDYAHTPEKITGLMSVASEHADDKKQNLVIIYEPLTNRRMHHMKEQHVNIFKGASQLYWVPSYLAREDPTQEILSPQKLITYLDPETQAIASPMLLDDQLSDVITQHLSKGDLVVGLSGGGGGSLDEWLRRHFTSSHN